MDGELAGAVSLARALMALGRAQRQGILEVWGQGARARVELVGGIPQSVTALAGADEPLGDALLRAGQFDWQAHRQAMEHHQPHRPIGHWLVERGVTTPSAVCHALGQQLRERLLCLFSLRALDYRFRVQSMESKAPGISPQLSVAALVLQGVKQALTDDAIDRVRRLTDGKTLQLTSLGRFFQKDRAILAEDASVLRLLNGSADWRTIETASLNSSAARQTVTALFYLSSVSVDSSRSASHSLLVRKHRQLRDQACPGALLDLPLGAPPSQARRALRRLIAQIHPDRVGPDAPYAVQHASCELLKALVCAENAFRTQYRP